MIGIDIVHIPEFEHQLALGGEALKGRAFHTDELKEGSLEHLAGVWAAKEAVMKALGLNAGKWLEIAISWEPNGRPVASVAGRQIDISIAHHGDYAVAVAVSP